MSKNNSSLSITSITEINKLSYEITEKGGVRCVYPKDDPPQYLDEAALSEWMRETRDTDSDLYAELVHAYMLLKKPSH